MEMTFTAKSLVPILGETLELPKSTALVIDRALAEADLRKKGKGRNWPEMLRSEAIIFMLACMVTRKPTQAAEDVKPWLISTCRIQAPDRPDPFDKDEWREEKDYQSQIRLLARAREQLPALAASITLVDWMLVVCALLEEGDLEADDVTVELTLSHGKAAVEFSTENGFPITQVFHVYEAESHSKPSASAIVTTSKISGATLLEVVRRTRRTVIVSPNPSTNIHTRMKG